ncbi:LacI family DNA-binding transcriptional regulator [Clostridium septicum]|uniref:LacI family DNA-binding transcriptional regulator n=1 Tax=Clostridium septicum TaxID=1504 RepID=A0A9N7PIF1_CLOSE|nr:LacI family DNA-binding transcriptional regulator [Clostridium septicum]AYE33671.1 LacI family transcriptional regulator [Clostridium septicum]MDU1315136.1 LacI family DNA-binding transcriptional regulator [Clostridium septicum]QAS61830.1 LacI family DNA-binding transcriptional regulator [Clostridium septicum]UEC21718.1 LacI family DNA-binding transcriptional regulator [Clostridium septicum]USS00230.1 LacI family DNA-binding transcriptional regulator [Clostridium septicum]
MGKGKKVTINDIATKASTSKTTVSFYLNGKFDKMSPDTKRRIEQAINETKYSPSIMARSLKSKKSNLIGVVVADITNPFSNNIVKGIDDVARKEGYQILVGSSNFEYNNEKKYIDRMLDMGVDGFIVQPTLNFNKLIKTIQDRGKKIVVLDSVNKEFKGRWVKTNNYDITSKATRELFKEGYEEFILVTEDPKLLMARMERKNGFEDSLKELGAKYSTLIIENDINYEDLAKLLREKINKDKKTLIFAINGRTLQKVFMTSKKEKWNVPNEIGIIGFDNWDWTFYASPSVTTIDQPTYEEGTYAASILIDMLQEKGDIEESTIFECSINWAESTNINEKPLEHREFQS